MAWRFRAGLATRLPALVVLSLLATAAVGAAVAIVIGRGLLREAALVDRRSDVASYASAVHFYVDSARSMLDVTAESPLMATPDGAQEAARRIVRRSTFFEYVMLLRPDGVVAVLEPEALRPRLSHTDLSFNAWFADALRADRSVVSGLHISPVTQRPTVVIAVPVRAASGRMTGVWTGALKLGALSEAGTVHGADRQTGFGFVTDRRGLILAHQTKPYHVAAQTDVSSLPVVQAALAGRRGEAEFLNPIDGEAQLGAYRPLADLGWAVVFLVPAQAAFAALDALTQGIVVAFAIMAIVIGAVALVVARRVAAPLRQLTAAAATIGTGDFSQRIDVRTGDEVARLATAFNRMTVALAEQDAELRRRAEGLQQANRELEAFSYSVSHDLRAPIRAIHGFTRILVEEAAALPDSSRRYLDLVRQNAEQMGHLIDDLLAFSRLGRQPLKADAVDHGALAREVVTDLTAALDGRAVDVVFGELPPSRGDPALFRQVWMNLIDNALKFSRGREPARVEVGARHDQAAPVYFVRDNGVGFEMRYADKLFGVFQRLHRVEDFEGTGVGLAIVQRIVHRHGGRVWAEAEVDRGAAFFFTADGRGQS